VVGERERTYVAHRQPAQDVSRRQSLECSTYIERSKNMSTPPVKNNPPVVVSCCRSLEVLCAALYLLSRKPPQSLYDRQPAPFANDGAMSAATALWREGILCISVSHMLGILRVMVRASVMRKLTFCL
jgi:hypothetical protein